MMRKICLLIFSFAITNLLWCDTEMPKENYKENFLFDLKVDESPANDVFVDANENFYVIHSQKPIIEIFDKTGNFIRKIDWKNPYPKKSFGIKVDEDGNILIFGADVYGYPGFILDKDGKLIASFKVAPPMLYAFSKGNLYQVTDGKVLYSLPSAKTGPRQKLFFKDFAEMFDKEKLEEERKNHIYLPNNHLHLPARIGKFRSMGLWAVTRDGTSFVIYDSGPIYMTGPKKPDQLEEWVKFDPSFNLVGVIPIEYFPIVNMETGELYEAKYEKGIVKMYRWDKIN